MTMEDRPSSSLLVGADLDTSTAGQVRQIKRAGELLSAFAAGDGTRLHGHLAAGLVDGDAAMVLGLLAVAQHALRDAAQLQGVAPEVYLEQLVAHVAHRTVSREVV
jgi:hypothetical protein